jgi:hypothetical protein
MLFIGTVFKNENETYLHHHHVVSIPKVDVLHFPKREKNTIILNNIFHTDPLPAEILVLVGRVHKLHFAYGANCLCVIWPTKLLKAKCKFFPVNHAFCLQAPGLNAILPTK